VTALTLVEMLLNTRVWLYAESKLSPLKKISKPPLQKYDSHLIEITQISSLWILLKTGSV